MQVITQYSYLRAAVNHTAKRDVRFYLNGVFIGDGVIAATCGHQLLMINDDNVKGMNHIIPSDVIKSLVRKVGTKFKGNVSIEVKDDGFGLMSCDGNYEYFRFIDGKFPDIKRVDIKEPEKPVAHWLYVNPDYLQLFKKSYEILIGSNHAVPIVMQTGENSSMYIKMTDYAHGILMPMRQ